MLLKYYGLILEHPVYTYGIILLNGYLYWQNKMPIHVLAEL